MILKGINGKKYTYKTLLLKKILYLYLYKLKFKDLTLSYEIIILYRCK